MIKGALIGAGMAAMMLVMLHDRIMTTGFDLTTAGLAFVGLHIAAGLSLLSLTLVIPAFRRRLSHHRPRLAHVMSMMVGAVALSGAAHLWMHGGFA